ncbi:MAG: nitrogenase molybdenum-iron protein subunit beta [Treponema sp.]|nr:nitrogenase molybdenum-iron protein subunit beta [Treponema sp.]
MYLRHTPKEIVERQALTINAAKTCQPIGAMYAALGVHNCLPHSHGSQGCCAYHRSSLTRHYNDPIMATTSSFSEGSSVFGGMSNLNEAIKNIFTLYNPDIIAVHTTCLSEVIGDDLGQIIKSAYQEGRIPQGKIVMHTNTPSFKGSHVTGFSNMTASFISYLTKSSGIPNGCINIIPTFIEPSDMSEIKRMLTEMGIKFIMLPDTSDVVNGPMDGKFHMFPKGGTTKEQIAGMGDSTLTVGLGQIGAEAAPKLLNSKFKVPMEILDLPIGLRATDEFVNLLHEKCGTAVPESLELERGQLLDAMIDKNQYLNGKKVSIVGDPDIVISMCRFCRENDMKVIHAVSGTPTSEAWEVRLKEICGPQVLVKTGERADMFYLHQLIKNEKPDLLMGNTYAKEIARDEDIPLVRIGYPIYDRMGQQYMPVTGYRGGMRLFCKVLETLMDRQDQLCKDEDLEFIM